MLKDKEFLITGMLKRRSFALYKLGRYEDALSDIDIAIRILLPGRKDAQMHLLVTDIKLATGDYTGALESCQQGLRIALKKRKAAKRHPTETEREVLRIFEQLIVQVTESDESRHDPFESLPADVIEIVMQHGLDHDEHFALGCTWLSSLWRQTLESMPSIWRAYTYDSAAIDTLDEKREAWARNGKNRFNEITLRNVDTYSALMDIDATCVPHFPNMHTLKLAGTTLSDLNVVRYIGESLSSSYNVKALHLQSFHSHRIRGHELDLGLITSENRATLQELHLSGIHFYAYHAPKDESMQSACAALRILSLHNCRITPDYTAGTNERTRNVEHRAQQDHVHHTLRRARNLETLAIALNPSLLGSSLYRYSATFSREMKLLPHLHTLRIPPPCVWSIDISTPRVRHLAFTFEGDPIRTSRDEPGRDNGQDRYDLMRNGLVPSLDSFAPTGIDVGRLVTVELMINGGDTEDILLEWLRKMESVERLSVVSAKLLSGTASQLSLKFAPKMSRLRECQVGPNPAKTANRSLIKLLNDNPLMCPKLRELSLSDVRTPEAPLLAWIRARKEGDIAVSPISTLSLTHCTFISSASKQLLQQEVVAVHIVEPKDITRLNWQELCENWDKSLYVRPAVDKANTQPSDQMQI
ncbi:hypothetical protein QFC22_001191 [Naganishia vaughanmartiniae]|uniref:Uncharacterized protein n=1 Tax=Naganishia vaughanmartiniae TaxID=1424756 RepID=A0ACC2XN02_9TREE|nr:hypothetical protein QFC22_001191 [Naganishia vaughanmartiniae]